MLTIFTPTYNRKEKLKRLYQSLCEQGNKKFTWLIVDDGSTDNTAYDVAMWKKESQFPIKYYYKENGGKHTAYNFAVGKCSTKYFVCVDSDDRLSKNAVDIIYDGLDRAGRSKKVAGIVFPSWDGRHRASFPRSAKYASIKDLYDRLGYRGETALVFKASVLRKHLFPVFEGEKFVPESAIYDAISKKHVMLLDNRVFYRWQYQEDGYTKNVDRLLKENPKGFSYAYHQKIALAEGFWDRLRQYARYIMWCVHLGVGVSLTDNERRYMAALALPWAFLLYLKRAVSKWREGLWT